jgi:hypothetical protein
MNKKDFDIFEENTYICTKCYARQNVIKHSSSYTDIDRVNISSKYMYDPKIHFRDCIKQYQGKQNCTIPEKVYKLNMGDKQVSFTGAELLETNTAFLALFDAKKSGDENKIKEAMELISKL